MKGSLFYHERPVWTWSCRVRSTKQFFRSSEVIRDLSGDAIILTRVDAGVVVVVVVVLCFTNGGCLVK